MPGSSPLSAAALELLARRAAASRGAENAKVARGPLSYPQLTQWFFAQVDPHSTVFNLPKILSLRGNLDVAALHAALQWIMDRHEALRTTFHLDGAEPVQRVTPDVSIDIAQHDLRNLTGPDRDSAVATLLEQSASLPFDLTADPLMRTLLVRTTADAWQLQVTFHHIAFDGWSTELFLGELEAGYRAAVSGGDSPHAPLAVQVADAAATSRAREASAESRRDLAYWREQLHHFTRLELPLDYGPEVTTRHRGARERVRISPEIWRAVAALAKQHGATAFTVSFAAWSALAIRRCGSTQGSIGVNLAGRTDAACESLLGNFVNVVPMQVRLAPELTFLDLMAQVQRESAAVLSHENFPIQQLIAGIPALRAYRTESLFPAAFNLRNVPARQPGALPGLEITGVDMPVLGSMQPITLNLTPEADGVIVDFEYDPDQISAASAVRWLDGYRALLAAALDNPDSGVLDLPVMGQSERGQLAGWNATARPRERGEIVAVALARQFAATPDRVAVTASGEEWKFKELAAHSSRIANLLRHRNAGPGSYVAVCMEKCAGLVAAIAGVLETGAAYLPIDPAYPAKRISAMLDECAATVIVTGPGAPAVLLGDSRTMPWDAAAESPRSDARRAAPADPAYVMFTSGSTGRPKGVVISQSAIMNHMDWMLRDLPIAPGDAVLQQTSIGFDASVWEFLAPLFAGSRMVLAPPGVQRNPDAVIELIVREKVAVIQVVPTMLRALLDTGRLAAATSLRRVCAGGEALTWDIIAQFHRQHAAQLVNLYGPTETTIDATFWIVDQWAGQGPVPIGRPISNMHAWVLDANRRECAVGTPGELHVGGDGVGNGYLARQELTAERFLKDPFGGGVNRKMYRSGDLVRWRDSGVLEFMGRLDSQLKLRGLRIEPGEIEVAVSALPGVRLAAVVVEPDPAGEHWLACYLELAAGCEFDVAGARRTLRTELPAHMIPSRFVVRDLLPRTASGKIDRAALAGSAPHTPGNGGILRDTSAPESTLEYTLRTLWQRLLAVDHVSVDDDFFELGGHSLLAARMVHELLVTTGHRLPLAMLFEASTIRSLMPRLLAHSFPGADAAVRAVQGGNPQQIPFFMLTGDMMGGGFYTRGLANALPLEQPLYAVNPVPAAANIATIEGMAVTHLRDIQQLQPRGPYRLGGYCSGGLVAYEMARQLQLAGERVDLLVLVDTFAPRSYGTWVHTAAEAVGRIASSDERGRIDRVAYLKTRAAEQAALPVAEQLGIVASYPFRLAQRWFQRLSGRTPTPTGTDPSDVAPDSLFRRTMLHHGRAQQAYRHRRYDGRIDLLSSRNSVRSPERELAKWRRVAPNVVVHEAPGTHTEILFSHLPGTLREQLARVDSAGGR